MKPQSLLSKLLTFSSVTPVATSVTVLDDMVPLAVELVRQKTVGLFNLANEGALTYDALLATYRDAVDPALRWNMAVTLFSRFIEIN